MENKNYGCGIFIDLKKAFYTVDHDILIQKLEHYGMHATSLNWFISYMPSKTMNSTPRICIGPIIILIIYQLSEKVIS